MVLSFTATSRIGYNNCLEEDGDIVNYFWPCPAWSTIDALAYFLCAAFARMNCGIFSQNYLFVDDNLGSGLQTEAFFQR